MDTVICGLQQIGVGVTDVKEAYNWYIKAFGMDIMICDARGVAERMLPYTGGKPRPRRAILAVNLQGGGGMEVWEPKNEIHPAPETVLGDLGINMGRIKAADIQKAYSHLKSVDGAQLPGEVGTAPDGQRHFFVKDPFGNLFDVVEDGYIFAKTGFPTGGSDGAMIGVSDMNASVDYYTRLLGLDVKVCDETGIFEDLQCIPGGEGRFRRVRLSRSQYGEGPLGRVYGTYSLELVQALDRTPKALFEGRWWGDPGFIQICLDVRNMEGIRARVQSLGGDFVCDGGDDFTMGDADGHFTYAVDPDGTMIEFVETNRIPVAKKFGIFVNLRGRDPHKNLPSMLLKALRLLKVKSIDE